MGILKIFTFHLLLSFREIIRFLSKLFSIFFLSCAGILFLYQVFNMRRSRQRSCPFHLLLFLR